MGTIGDGISSSGSRAIVKLTINTLTVKSIAAIIEAKMQPPKTICAAEKEGQDDRLQLDCEAIKYTSASQLLRKSFAKGVLNTLKYSNACAPTYIPASPGKKALNRCGHECRLMRGQNQPEKNKIG